MRYRQFVPLAAVLALCVTHAVANVPRTNTVGTSALTPLVVTQPAMVSMAHAPARMPASIGPSPINVVPAVAPMDRVDPWSGVDATDPVTIAARRETDKVDPWSGQTMVVPQAHRLLIDATDPWTN